MKFWPFLILWSVSLLYCPALMVNLHSCTVPINYHPLYYVLQGQIFPCNTKCDIPLGFSSVIPISLRMLVSTVSRSCLKGILLRREWSFVNNRGLLNLRVRVRVRCFTHSKHYMMDFLLLKKAKSPCC